MPRWWIGGLVVVVAVGCGTDPKEGVNPGECSDGADNDADGYFDCNDIDCAFSPDCEGDDTDPGENTSDTDPKVDDTEEPDDTDDAPVNKDGVAAHLKSFALTYEVELKFDQLGQKSCEAYLEVEEGEPCDCVAVYRASGQLIESELERNTYEGRFELVSSDCPKAPENASGPFAGMTLNDAAIYRHDSGDSFHTFRFDRDVSEATEWIAHRFEDGTTTTKTPFEDEQWWMRFTEGGNDVDPETLWFDYKESELTQVNLIFFTAKHHLAVQFSEDPTPPDDPVLPE